MLASDKCYGKNRSGKGGWGFEGEGVFYSLK